MKYKVLLNLNDSWRVRDHAHQWILQHRKKPGARWRERSFCATRTGLLLVIGEHCGDIEDEAQAVLDRWPRLHRSMLKTGEINDATIREPGG